MPSSGWTTTGAAGSATAGTTPLGTASSVSTLNNDDILSMAKKPQLITDYNAELQIQTQLVAQANGLGVSHSAYDTAVASMTTDLTGLSPSWSDVTQDTPLGVGGGNVLRVYWTAIANQRALLQKACQDKIQSNAAYADALARSSYNLVKNAGTDNTSPPSGSYEAAGLWNIEATPGNLYSAMSGSGFCRLTQVGAGGGVAYVNITPVIPCVPGEQFYVRGLGTGPSNGGTPKIIVQTTGPGGLYYNFTTNVASGVLTSPSVLEYPGGITVPAGHVGIQVILALEGAGANSYAFFNRIYLSKKIGAGMLEADIGIFGVLRSGGGPGTGDYVAGTSSTAAQGFKISGIPFSITYRTGASANGQAEFGRDVSAAGFSFADTALRAINNIDFTNLNGSLAGAGTRYFWKGNNNPTVNLGVPDITRFTVYAGNDFSGVWANMGGSGISKLRFQVYLAPSSRDNNLDGMLSITANLYDRTTTALKLLDGKTQAFNGRVYARPDSDGNASNTGYMHTLEFIVPGTFWADIANVPNANGSWANVAVKLECCNAYGMSAARWWGFQRSGTGGPVVPVDLGGATPPSGYTLAGSNVTVVSPGVGSATGGSNPSWTGQYL